MIVGGEFVTPIFRVQLNGWQCLQMLKKFKGKGKFIYGEDFTLHFIRKTIKHKGMTLDVLFQFNRSEWDKRTDLIQKFENDELTEVVNSGEWL
jgi:hypothetical protein